MLDLTGCVVSIVGDDPYNAIDLLKITEQFGALPGVLHLSSIEKPVEVWQAEQRVVIGRRLSEADRQYILRTVVFGKTPYAKMHELSCMYMSQEDYLHHLTTEDPPNYIGRLDLIREHVGLSYLSTIGFVWPSVNEALPQTRSGIRSRGNGKVMQRLPNESWLKGTYGYQVGGNVSDSARRRALANAVKGEGLRKVALFIASFLIVLNKRKTKPPWDAIDTWKADLDWLKRDHYDTSYHSFLWPGY